MEITKELLVAKLNEYKAASQEHKALADANFGAAQAMEELLRVAESPEPLRDPPEVPK